MLAGENSEETIATYFPSLDLAMGPYKFGKVKLSGLASLE